MVMVAVKDFDIDTRLGHPPREGAQLAWHVLLQSLHKYFAFSEHLDASGFERLARGDSIGE